MDTCSTQIFEAVIADQHGTKHWLPIKIYCNQCRIGFLVFSFIFSARKFRFLLLLSYFISMRKHCKNWTILQITVFFYLFYFTKSNWIEGKEKQWDKRNYIPNFQLHFVSFCLLVVTIIISANNHRAFTNGLKLSTFRPFVTMGIIHSPLLYAREWHHS